MADITKLIELVIQKNKLCHAYEQGSNNMLTCDADQLPNQMQERVALAEQIDTVNAEIAALCSGSDGCGEAGLAAVRNSCSRGDLPDAYQIVFDLAQDGFASLYRAKNIESLILDRIQSELQQLENNIKQMRNTPGILEYLKTGIQLSPNGVLLKNEI